jgi:HicB family
MIRLTLRLPESLHRTLADQAQREGVSLNHYIVFSLTRAVTVADLAAQQRAFERLSHRFPAEDAEAALGELLAART